MKKQLVKLTINIYNYSLDISPTSYTELPESKDRKILIDDLCRVLGYIFYDQIFWLCQIVYDDKTTTIDRNTLPYYTPRVDQVPGSYIRRVCKIFGKENLNSIIKFSKKLGCKIDLSKLSNEYKFITQNS